MKGNAMERYITRKGTSFRTVSTALRTLRSIAIATTGFALFAGAAQTASATEQFKFSYTVPSGFSGPDVVGTGILNAELIAPGEWLALSGWDQTSGGSISGKLALLANPNAPSESYSPSGFFLYDDLLLPHSDPLIQNGGLLFTNGAGGEINLFSYGPDNYTHYDNTGFNVPITFSISPVPEPASLALFGAGLLALPLIRRRKAA
jgi:hypothetical protein